MRLRPPRFRNRATGSGQVHRLAEHPPWRPLPSGVTDSERRLLVRRRADLEGAEGFDGKALLLGRLP